MSNGGTSLARDYLLRGLWSVIEIPLKILLIGLVILLLVRIGSEAVQPVAAALAAGLQGATAASNFAAILIFLVGLGFAVFLWWLSSRFFDLIKAGSLDSDGMAAMRDLPLALPEGTVRALLALIVAMVGLPLLLFSKSLGLDDAIAGYVNGIITGVFGFYFGTRTAGVPTQAVNQITQAQTRAQEAERKLGLAEGQIQTSQFVAAAATRGIQFDTLLDKVNRHLKLASALLTAIGPALPPGLLPTGLKEAVAKAEAAVAAVQGVTRDTVTDDQLNQLNEAFGVLVGAVNGGGNSSGLGLLLNKAAPMLSGLAIPGLGPLAGLAMLLSVGARLGSVEFQRWRARVLAAPLATGLIEFGTVAPDDVRIALDKATIFAKAFEQVRDDPGFDADLADAVLRDDALERLWKRYGDPAQGQPQGQALFTDMAQLEAGLTEFRQVLLAARSVRDVPEELARQTAAVLAKAASPALRLEASGTLTPEHINEVIDKASRASASGAVAQDVQAAFDALITMVGYARRDGVDLANTLAEVQP